MQIVALGLCAHAYGTYFMDEKDPWFDRMRARYRLEHGLMLGGAIVFAGFVAAAIIIGIWVDRGFGALSEERLAVTAPRSSSSGFRSSSHRSSCRSSVCAGATPRAAGLVDLLAAWALYPLALGATCLGLALLVERLTAWRTPGALVVPVGFVTLLALVGLITSYDGVATLALPVVGGLAIVGLGVGRARLLALRPDPWLLATVAALLVVLGAPVVAVRGADLRRLPGAPGHGPSARARSSCSHITGPTGPSLAPGSFRLAGEKYVAVGLSGRGAGGPGRDRAARRHRPRLAVSAVPRLSR